MITCCHGEDATEGGVGKEDGHGGDKINKVNSVRDFDDCHDSYTKFNCLSYRGAQF